MAEPVIIVKENPGKLKVEIYDENGTMVESVVCENIPFSTADSDVEIDGQKFKAKKGGHGDAVEIKIKTPKK